MNESGIKPSDLGHVVEKIIHVISSAIKKIKFIGLLSQLRDDHDYASTEVQKALATYAELKRINDGCSGFVEEENALATKDRLLYLVAKACDSSVELNGDVAMDSNIKSFTTQLGAFRSVALHMLTQTASQWNQEQKFIEKYTKLSARNATIIAQLRNELPIAKAAKETAMKEKQVLVSEVQESIDRVERYADGDILFLRESAKNKILALERRSEEILSPLRQLEAKLKKMVEDSRVVNVPLHEESEKRIEDLERCVSWIVEKYDNKMMDLQRHFDYVWREFSNEMEKARNICTSYLRVKDVADAVAAENRKMYEERVRERLRRNVEHRAAICIQNFWRSWLAENRAPVPEKKEKKEGKKKKGKK